jgi:hypothetical protein
MTHARARRLKGNTYNATNCGGHSVWNMTVATHIGRFGLHPGTDVVTLVIFGVEPPAEAVAALLLTVELARGEAEVEVKFRRRGARSVGVRAWRVACPDLFEVGTEARWVARTWRLAQVVEVALSVPAGAKVAAQGRYCLSVPFER